MRKRGRTEKGFTLVELLVAAAIVLVVAGGFFHLLVLSFELNETSRNLTLALHGAEAKLEEMRNSINIAGEEGPFGGTNYFSSTNMTGTVVVVTNSSPYLVTVVVSWTQRGGRIIGEDDNLNGFLDTGEDDNLNGRLDSPAEIVTLMTDR